MFLLAIVLSLSIGDATAQSFLPVYQQGSGSFEIDMMIGGDIDDEEHFLWSPSALALDGQGNLFVLDFKGYCLKKFDPSGSHLLTFGSKGEGPGEMTMAFQMDLDQHGNAVIYDMTLHRFTFYDRDGHYAKSVKPNQVGWRNITAFHIDPSGRLYIQSRTPDMEDMHAPARFIISRLDTETLVETPIDSAVVKDFYVFTSDEGMMQFSAPYYPELMWDLAPSGNIIVCNSDDYRIKVYSPELTLLSEHIGGRDKPKLTDADKADYLAGWDDEETAELARKHAAFPKYKPYFDALLLDHEGYMLFRVADGEEGTAIYDVFTPEGEFVNKVTLPRLRGSSILADGAIYRVALYEEESRVVYRYRLQ